MLNIDGASAEGSQKINLSSEEQVIILPLEPGMRLLFDFELNVTGRNPWHLITFATEIDLMARLDTAVDMDVKDLPLDNSFLAQAALAAILVADDLSFTVAVRADGLEALDHGAHLAHHGLRTGTAATSAALDCTLLASAAVTLRANHRLLQRQFRDLSAVDIFQGDLVDVVNGAGLLRARISHSTTTTTKHATKGAASTTEELREQVLGIHPATAAALLQPFFSILIVHLPFLGIGQDLVGLGQVFELLGCFGVVCILVFREASQRDSLHGKM